MDHQVIIAFFSAFTNLAGQMMKSPVVPFVAPFFLFMIFLVVEGHFPDQHYAIYPFKILAVTAAIIWYWRAFPSLVPRSVLLSVVVGIVGVVLWIGLDPWAMKFDAILERAFNRVVETVGLSSWRMEVDGTIPFGRNPFQLYSAPWAWTLFGLRLAGIALCVPIMEELFWRGFLMRWLIKDDFASVPIGTYQPASFWVTTGLFSVVHGAEWPLGLIVGILYGAWFVRTKTLGDIMLAHGVTNLLLALYCLYANDWHFLSIVTPKPHVP